MQQIQLILLTLHFLLLKYNSFSYAVSQRDDDYELAIEALHNEDYSSSIASLYEVIRNEPEHMDALQLLGSLSLKVGNLTAAEIFLHRAISLSSWSNTGYIANYIEAVRRAGRPTEAVDFGELGLARHPNSTDIIYNLATCYGELRSFARAHELYALLVEANARHYEAWKRGSNMLMEASQFTQAEAFLRKAILAMPREAYLHYQLGIALHSQDRMLEALEAYLSARQLNPNMNSVYGSIAALYQGLGRATEAIEMYEYVIPRLSSDPGVLNNYGALLGTMNRYEESLLWLQRAYELDPTLSHTLINLGSHFQDEGNSALAYTYFQRALELHPESATLLHLRLQLIISPMSASWESMSHERNSISHNLSNFIHHVSVMPMPLDASLDRVPFYVSYHGLNDRHLIEKIVASYHKCINNLVFLSPSLMSTPLLPQQTMALTPKRIKVGFISKFFGIFEPHGLLLDGVMRYLPRSHFEVVCLPVARNDGKPLAPSVRRAADIVVDMSLSHKMVQEQISAMQLDVLVFADVMSEPMNHFLAHSRLAEVQVAFWGNPITSGSKQMDFFVSADCMEHPLRTRMPVADEPYSEQLVLLEGQGIWYNSPESPEVELKQANFNVPTDPIVYDRAHFGLSTEWFVYFCPQSVFKMHPLFDLVFRDILAGNGRGHVVVTGGRRASWTNMYTVRLESTLGPVLSKRLHIIPRVSSEKFLGLLRIADVLLHPFPFDGSRTSADGLIAGVPVLTLPTEHLRGRMGAAFYRTMDIPELVARNRSEYIRIAVDLCNNHTMYEHVTSLIVERTNLVWEDLQVPFDWARLLARVAGSTAPSWDEFLQQTGRDVVEENRLRRMRADNFGSFDRRWGKELWLLEDGYALLPSYLTDKQRPRVFDDWAPLNHSASTNDEGIREDIANPGAEALISRIRRLVRAQSLNEAASLAYEEMDVCRLDGRCLVDLGTIEYFRGEYEAAFKYCSIAAPISLAAHCCIGVVSIYLGRIEEAITSLSTALQLIDQQVVGDSSAVFVVEKNVLEGNLISALRSFGMFTQCAERLEEFMGLPPLQQGGALLVTLAVIDWSPARHDDLLDLQHRLAIKGELLLTSGKTLVKEIRRIQTEHAHILSNAVECITHSLPAKVWNELLQTLMDLIEKTASAITDAAVPSDVALITQYYETINSVGMMDMQIALVKNTNNPYISEVYLLTEYRLNLSSFNISGKIRQHVIGERLSYQTAFTFANLHLQNRTVILANADIYFDHTLNRLSNISLMSAQNEVLALLKWKSSSEGISLTLRTDSQDTWIFRPPIADAVIRESSFYLGLARCDNRLAYLLNASGYRVINPAFAIHSVELHTSARETPLYSPKGAVTGLGMNVLLSDLHLF